MEPSIGKIEPKSQQTVKLVFKSDQSGEFSEHDGLQLIIQLNISDIGKQHLMAKSSEIIKTLKRLSC